MTDFSEDQAEKLRSLIASNRPGRKAPLLCSASSICRALEILWKSKKIAIVTGFYIQEAKAPETDGPGGAGALARSLARAGKDVSLWTDRLCLEVLKAVSEVLGGLKVLEASEASQIMAWGPDLLVFVERLGRSKNGLYCNMRGKDVSQSVVPLDLALDMAEHKGIDSLAIGDGGNEAGMGTLYQDLSELLPDYRECLSTVKAALALPVDVSDWGGYGLAGALSHFTGFWCGVSGKEIKAMLEAEAASGAVDGVTFRRDLSIDGIPLFEHMALGDSIKELFSCAKP